MDTLIRAYAVRSVAPHLRAYHMQYDSYSNNNYMSQNDTSYYYIPQQRVSVLEDTSAVADQQDGSLQQQNASSAWPLLADTSSTNDFYDATKLLQNATATPADEYFAIYANFSCDGEQDTLDSLNATLELNNSELDTFFMSTYFKMVVYLIYIPIFLFALLGNGLVCYIVQSTPRMRTVTNYFIANLALGDILMSLFCVPFSFISMFILAYWPFGIALCYLVNYSQAVSVLVSAYTLVAISIDRYIAIMWPLRPRITKRYAKLIIAGVWGIALLTAFPIPLVSRLNQPTDWHQQCDRHICREEWPETKQGYYYTLALLTLQFVIPLLVLVFTYTRIALAVWGKRPPGEAENSRDQRMARSKRKMIKMMVTVVIVFTICWLPFNILVLLLNDEKYWETWKPLPYVWLAFHWLAMSHSCYNPIIYCYMNARFRGGFLQIIYRVPGLRRCCCLRRYLRSRGDRSYEATGTDDAFHLQRVNTSTTYISTRRKLRTNSMQASQFSCAETTVLR